MRGVARTSHISMWLTILKRNRIRVKDKQKLGGPVRSARAGEQRTPGFGTRCELREEIIRIITMESLILAQDER